MAKNKKIKGTKTTTTYHETNYQTVKFASFWAVAISSLLYIVGGILKFIEWLAKQFKWTVHGSLGPIGQVLNLIASILLVVALGIPAYNYVRGKGKSWKIIYWVAIVVFTLGIVFGFFVF